jgi:hypothetical protein
MDTEAATSAKSESPKGSCAIGCASVFVLIAVMLPLLYVVCNSYEPDILMLPILIGGPAFIVTHVLAITAACSQSAGTKRRGKIALLLVWGGIGFFVLVYWVCVRFIYPM